jgi:predicted phage terminase large subunit-like protein
MELTRAELQTIQRNDFASFIERAFYELNPQACFIPGVYIDLLAAKLEEVRHGHLKRLIINIPPRALKSHAASVAFPAWLLGHDPSKQILCASYGQDLADKHARDCRTLMSSSFYRSLFPETVLSADKNAVGDFLTTRQGFRLSVSVGGPITGRGADLIILDDPLKPEDALSEPLRTKTNEWYFHTLLSRLNSKTDGAIILIMQRLHEDDLTGTVQEHEPWDVLSLPAIAISEERYEFETLFGRCVFQRAPGQVLHPQRDTVDTFHRLRESIGEYNFESQYQQSPLPAQGGWVKRSWLHYYSEETKPNRFSMIVQSWDTANKAGRMHDYSVCTTWGIHQKRFYLLHVHRQRLDYPTLKRVAKELYDRFRPGRVIVEDKASGTALIQEMKAGGMHCVEAYRPDAGTDKQVRFAVHSVKFESGQVLLPQSAPWLREYEAEILGFPGTKFDDQVDSTSQALAFMSSNSCACCELDIAVGRPTSSEYLSGYVGSSLASSAWSYFR